MYIHYMYFLFCFVLLFVFSPFYMYVLTDLIINCCRIPEVTRNSSSIFIQHWKVEQSSLLVV